MAGYWGHPQRIPYPTKFQMWGFDCSDVRGVGQFCQGSERRLTWTFAAEARKNTRQAARRSLPRTDQCSARRTLKVLNSPRPIPPPHTTHLPHPAPCILSRTAWGGPQMMASKCSTFSSYLVIPAGLAVSSMCGPRGYPLTILLLALFIQHSARRWTSEMEMVSLPSRDVYTGGLRLSLPSSTPQQS